MTDKVFHSIFSKRKVKPKEKLKIIADFREKNSMVIAELISLNIEVEFKQLEVGDYLLGEIAIERKTASDLIGSMISKRIFSQLDSLKQYQKSLLIIEGYQNLDLAESNLNENVLKGLFLSISLEFQMPILFAKDAKDTAAYLSLLSKKKKSEFSLRAKLQMTDMQRLQFILEGFPGIGPKTAQKLLQEYKTIKNIINAEEEGVKHLLGKKADKFLDLLKKEYQVGNEVKNTFNSSTD